MLLMDDSDLCEKGNEVGVGPEQAAITLFPCLASKYVRVTVEKDHEPESRCLDLSFTGRIRDWRTASFLAGT